MASATRTGYKPGEYMQLALGRLRGNIKAALQGEHSFCGGRLPWVWCNLVREAEIETVYEWFAYEDLVDIKYEPDDCTSMDDLVGDMFDESHADTIPGGLRTLRQQRKDFELRVEMDGVWVMDAVFYKTDGTPETADSIGGFVGEDFWGSGYEEELMLAALAGLFEDRGMTLPPYTESKDGAWQRVVFMMWELHGRDAA